MAMTPEVLAKIAELKRNRAGNSKLQKAERKIQELVGKANTPAGTEERKKIKQMMTHSYRSQTIQSNDFSSGKSQRTGSNVIEGLKERGEKSCRKSSKCDKRINSYYAAKSSVPRF